MNRSTDLDILGCPCAPLANEDQASSRLEQIVESAGGGYSVAINAEKITRYSNDHGLRKTIDNAALVYPDGAGAVLGLRWIHGVKSRKINMPIVALETANKNRWRVFLLGATEENNQRVAEIVARKYPQINLVGRLNGFDQDARAKSLTESNPQLVMVAMGSPRQELVAAELMSGCPKAFFVGCGGAFDILAGKIKRAPKFMVENNLEWLYRLVKQPFRWKRQLVLPVFFCRLVGASVRTAFSSNAAN